MWLEGTELEYQPDVGHILGAERYRVLQNGCHERHSTRNSPLNFDLILYTVGA